MALVRSQILKRLADLHPNILRKDINRCVSIIFSEIIAALSGNKFSAVELRRFGRFSTKIQKARIARNPATGVQISIPQKRVLKWKCSKKLLKRLNEH